MSTILGIDPGSHVTGFGIVRTPSSRQVSAQASLFEVVCFGVIQLNSEATLSERLKELGEALQPILQKYKPSAMAIEKIFLGKNADSAFKLGHARGVIMYEAGRNEIPVFEYATRIVKKSVTGRGGATKEEVQTMLKRLLRLKSIRHLDASDALALAVHHAYGEGSRRIHQRLSHGLAGVEL